MIGGPVHHVGGAPPEFVGGPGRQGLLAGLGHDQLDVVVVAEVHREAFGAVDQQEIVDEPDAAGQGTVGHDGEVVSAVIGLLHFILAAGHVIGAHAVVDGEVAGEARGFRMGQAVGAIVATVEDAQPVLAIGQLDVHHRHGERIGARHDLQAVLVAQQGRAEALHHGLAQVGLHPGHDRILVRGGVVVAEPVDADGLARAVERVVAGVFAATRLEQGVFEVVLSLRVGAPARQGIVAVAERSAQDLAGEVEGVGVGAISGGAVGGIPHPAAPVLPHHLDDVVGTADVIEIHGLLDDGGIVAMRPDIDPDAGDVASGPHVGEGERHVLEFVELQG